jgi:hypothetical protein
MDDRAGVFWRINGVTRSVLFKSGGTMTGALGAVQRLDRQGQRREQRLQRRLSRLAAERAEWQLHARLTDIGKRIYSKNTGAQAITIPANATVAFPVDDTMIAIVNRGTTALTIVPAGGVTLERAGTTSTGTRTLAAKGRRGPAEGRNEYLDAQRGGLS